MSSRASQIFRLAPPSPKASVRPKRVPPPPTPYPVFVAYADVTAAREALSEVARHLRRSQAPDFKLEPMLWRFNQLDAPQWREMALHDASRARLVVLALGQGPTLDTAGELWLDELTLRQRGARTNALAFLGKDEMWTISLQHTGRAAAPRAAVPQAESAAGTLTGPAVMCGEAALAACAA